MVGRSWLLPLSRQGFCDTRRKTLESQHRARRHDDPTLGPPEIYHREAKAYVDGEDLSESGEILVTHQGCRENAVCYSPITKSIDLATHSRMQAE
ncbi:protein-disulfide reductase DsbD domain-containing protein [Bradyrhizobium sp. Ash2021]|uniref:protein-disulfide reductase DsbD domain-containing protein n=1 Tax=Bradyrhizobium sp. Ash2021 TaxID=2954771 RepID=UPI0035BF83B9